jgi:hypothetical protein
MPQRSGSPAPAPKPATPKQALIEAFDTVLKTQAEAREAERAADEARRRRRGVSRLLMVLCTTVVVFVGVYLSVERPEWVFPTSAEAESVATREASMRIMLANAAQHIERYKQQTGQLPTSLRQAGAHATGIAYEPTPTGYRLRGDDGEVSLTFTSGESLPRFVGNSFEVIARRPR